MSQPPSSPARPPLPEGAVQVRLRRAPRYRPFVGTGSLLGLVLGLLVAGLTGRGPDGFSDQSLIGYFGAIGLLVGAVLGAGVAVLLERLRG